MGIKMIRFFLVACIAGLAVGTAQAQQDKCSGPQIGTWKLTTYTREEIVTGEKQICSEHIPLDF